MANEVSNIIDNGDFESGDFQSWQTFQEGDGDFFVIENGGSTPTSGQITEFDQQSQDFIAVSDQSGPGTNVLRQTFTVPENTDSLSLSFDMFVNDQSETGPIIADVGLDHTGPDNQHARVDILTEGAGPTTTAEADVVENLFIGIDEGQTPNPFVDFDNDLTDILDPGETYQLRFAQVDNQLNFNQGVDNVELLAEENENTMSGPIGEDDDFVVLQQTSPAVLSAGVGDDTYILSQGTLNGDEELTLQDGQGINSIQLVEGLQIARSTVAANALQLELANGSVINVNGADAFSYEPGGNAVAGVDGEEVSFETFVSETLGTDVPASGTSEGGSVTIGAAEGTPLPVGTSQTVSATDEAETFTLDRQEAADTASNTQIDLEGFDPAGDTLEIDLAPAFEAPGVNTLDELDGVRVDGAGNQANVSSNPVTNATTATLGPDADGDVIALSLVGVTEPEMVDLAIV